MFHFFQGEPIKTLTEKKVDAKNTEKLKYKRIICCKISEKVEISSGKNSKYLKINRNFVEISNVLHMVIYTHGFL